MTDTDHNSVSPQVQDHADRAKPPPLTYGCVCSGISAPTLAAKPLGWKTKFFSEIEAFPRAVLKHHYADTPCHGDFTTIGADDYGPIDLLVGGTPCQDFSVAGLRSGLEGDRGNLTMQFLKLLQRLKPEWVVWENVPGIVSIADGDALKQFLDGLEELGYVIDIEILDAQFHGVPQRRRRVFVCGQLAETLIRQKTHTSAQTIAQCLVEILQGILADHLRQSGRGQESLALPRLSRDGVTRRMKLFGLLTDTCNFPILRENLIAEFLRCQSERNGLESRNGTSRVDDMPVEQSRDSETENPYTLTEPLLKKHLDEAYEVMKSYTTSTVTKTTTQGEIFICSQAALSIARLIAQSNATSPSFWSAASSALTANQEFMSYARFSDNDLFARLGGVYAWHDFIREAERTDIALGDCRVECFGEVFPVRESMRGDSAPSRSKEQEVAGTFTARAKSGGWGQDVNLAASGYMRVHGFGGGNCSGPVEVADCLTAKGVRQDFEVETFVTHTLRGEGFDASEDGTGRGTPLVPVGYRTSGNCGAWATGDKTDALTTGTDPSSHVIAYPINTQMALRCAETSNSSREGIGVGEQNDRGFTLQANHSHAIALSLCGRDGGATAERQAISCRAFERHKAEEISRTFCRVSQSMGLTRQPMQPATRNLQARSAPNRPEASRIAQQLPCFTAPPSEG